MSSLGAPASSVHGSDSRPHRLACLHVADFPLVALLRAEPDLCGAAVAVAAEHGPRATLIAVSAAAAQRGITAGLRVAQAIAIAADLVVRCVAPDLLHAAQAALCDVAASCSPRLEDAGGGIVYVDVGGLGALFATEAQLATVLAQRAAQLGLDAHVGIAGSKIAAVLAARNGGGVTVIPPGEEWSFLAPVPVAWLEPSPELRATLQRWGIRCIGELTALSTRALGTRLGPEGVQLARRARGEDEQPLVPRPLPLHFEEGAELDYGIYTLEPLLFVLRGLLDRLTARLAVRGLVCGDVRLWSRLDNGGRDARTVAVAVPSNDVKALLALVRLHLEAHPPDAALAAVRVTAVAERLRAAQLDLFRPHGPAPDRLAVTLARLTAICGADRVGMPVVADSHRPDAYGMAPFPTDEVVRTDEVARRDEVVRLLGCDVVSDIDHSAPHNLAANNLTTCPAIALALRAIRPPQAAEVFCARGRPDFVRGAAFAGRVVQVAGPWRVHGDWWNEERYARDYYDAQLSDGGVYRLYCDLATQRWFVDGVYD